MSLLIIALILAVAYTQRVPCFRACLATASGCHSSVRPLTPWGAGSTRAMEQCDRYADVLPHHTDRDADTLEHLLPFLLSSLPSFLRTVIKAPSAPATTLTVFLPTVCYSCITCRPLLC